MGGYVLDSGGVMLSGYDGKRQAYDTAGLVGVRFEDIAGGFLEFELLSQFRNRPLLSVVNSCMGSDRENDGSSAWRTGHCVAGKLTSSFGIPRVAQHLLIGFAGNFEDGLNWVLFRLQNHSAHSEFTYAFGTQNKTNPGFAGRVYIYGVQHAVESAGMWKSVTRPCAIDSEGCITSHNFPRFYGSQEHCSLDIDESLTGPLRVTDFETEKNHDVLLVNGQAYSGTDGPQGVTPYQRIIWRSDHSISKGGWRLCPPRATSQEVQQGHPPHVLVGLPAIVFAGFCMVCCAPSWKSLRRWGATPSPSARVNDFDQEHSVCGDVETMCDEVTLEDPVVASEIRTGLLERMDAPDELEPTAPT